MDEKDIRIEQLEDLVASLRRQVSVLNQTIAEYHRMEDMRRRDDYDYVGYEEDLYDR